MNQNTFCANLYIEYRNAKLGSVNLILYHGTLDRYADSIKRDGIILSKSKKFLDFGPGFYLTEDYNFACETAKRRSFKNNQFPKNEKSFPAVIKLKYNPSICCFSRQFLSPDKEWGTFIYNNRHKNEKALICNLGLCLHNRAGIYDIVSGPIADGNVIAYFDTKVIGMTETILNNISPKKDDPFQVSFHTETAITALEFLSYNIIRG